MTELPESDQRLNRILNLFLWGWVLAILFFYLYGLRVILGNVLKFVREARRQNITHMLLPDDWGPPYGAKTAKVPFFRMIRLLESNGCLKRLASFETLTSKSRTMGQLETSLVQTNDALFELDLGACRMKS